MPLPEPPGKPGEPPDPDGTLWAATLGPGFLGDYQEGLESLRSLRTKCRCDADLDRLNSRLDSRSAAPPRSALLDLLAESPEARGICRGMERQK
jgi:hypothetical protein